MPYRNTETHLFFSGVKNTYLLLKNITHLLVESGKNKSNSVNISRELQLRLVYGHRVQSDEQLRVYIAPS